MPMKRQTKLMFLTAVLVVNPYMAFACSCAPPPPANEAANRSDRVFLGKVTSIQTYKSPEFVMWLKDRLADIGEAFGADWRRDISRDFRQQVTLHVVENFKGAPVKNLVISTGWGGGDCGVPFDSAQTYLVFARHIKERNELVTGICDGTAEAKRSQPQLAQLRAGI